MHSGVRERDMPPRPTRLLQTALVKEAPFCAQVNISEDERDLIWSLSSKGLLNRLLYHRAKVAIFPILIHFWKRYEALLLRVAEAAQMPASASSHLVPLAQCK